MKLYQSNASPNSRRVRIFLAEKSISMPLVPVDLGAKEQFSDAYAAINPGAALSKRLGAAIAFLVALMGMQFSSFELRGLSVNGEALVLCSAAFLCAGREAIASRES